MDYNILTYTIYLPITGFITIWVGYVLFKNGEPFILKQLNGDQELTRIINKVLLIGFYLLNLGYCLYIISLWDEIEGKVQMIESLSETIGFIVLGLGLMHFVNITALILLGVKKEKTIN